MLIVFVVIFVFSPFHGGIYNKTCGNGPQVCWESIYRFLRKRFNPWDKNTLFVCSQMHRNLERKKVLRLDRHRFECFVMKKSYIHAHLCFSWLLLRPPFCHSQRRFLGSYNAATCKTSD